jgi:hypothetical protein
MSGRLICRPASVSIPYWLGSKLRVGKAFKSNWFWMYSFQSPIGWGLSCEVVREAAMEAVRLGRIGVSIPYWLGSKLRGS